jgi:hypothetical protein
VTAVGVVRDPAEDVAQRHAHRPLRGEPGAELRLPPGGCTNVTGNPAKTTRRLVMPSL